MLDIKPPAYKYCPFCGKVLQLKSEDGHSRLWCPIDKWTYYPHVPCSAGVLLEKDGKYLMVKRNRNPYLGTWMFPAGFVGFGENLEEAAIREAREETGYEVVSVELIRVWQVIDDNREPGHFAFFYRGKLGEKVGEIEDHEENSDMGWFAPNEFPEIGWEGQRKIAEELVAGRL